MQREDAIRRIMAQAGGNTGEPGSTGTATRTAAPSDGYTGRVIARIKPNIVFIDTLASNPEAEVLVRLAPDGRIISQKLVQSSGSPVGRGRAARDRPHRHPAARRRRPGAVEHVDHLPAAESEPRRVAGSAR
jgi:hypothetical protein